MTIVEAGAGGEGFQFTVQGALVAGPQVVTVLNASDQPHFNIALQDSEPITEEQLMATLAPDLIRANVRAGVDLTLASRPLQVARIQSAAALSWLSCDAIAIRLTVCASVTPGRYVARG